MIITFILIQEVEGHILVPVIMGSRFRVHPLVVIFAILAGGEIHGITGMLIAIPLIPLIKETYVVLPATAAVRGLVRRRHRQNRCRRRQCRRPGRAFRARARPA